MRVETRPMRDGTVEWRTRCKYIPAASFVATCFKDEIDCTQKIVAEVELYSTGDIDEIPVRQFFACRKTSEPLTVIADKDYVAFEPHHLFNEAHQYFKEHPQS